MGNLTPELAALRDETRDLAKSYGLDFYEVIFELVDHDELNMVASYGGFPVRYPHWRFGMEYEHLTKSYAYGLSKIYELVVNNDPCYAYLMRSNSITEQKLVMAHVYGHCDFFKNNAWFGHTSRKMMDVLANHGARIRRYMDRHGQERVENFIDVVHSLDNLIDPYSPYIDRGTEPRAISHAEEQSRREVKKIAAKDYMDRYINPPEFLAREREKMVAEETQARRFPAKPARDVLKFLLDHAPLETRRCPCRRPAARPRRRGGGWTRGLRCARGPARWARRRRWSLAAAGQRARCVRRWTASRCTPTRGCRRATATAWRRCAATPRVRR